VDVVNGSGDLPMDLSTDFAWDTYSAMLPSVDFVFMGIDCKTFSRARQNPHGPPPLRSLEFPYGFPNSQLGKSDAEKLRLGNYFAIQSAKLASRCLSVGVGFAIENPEPWDTEAPSLWLLDEFVQLAADPRVQTVDFDQCMWDSETKKPTRVMFFKVNLLFLGARCSHPSQSWHFFDKSGAPASSWGPHPPLINRSRDGAFATAAAAAYPSALNRAFADAISVAHRH